MKLTDVVNRINGNVDRFTTDLEYYIGGEHFESDELIINKRGIIKENLGKLGFKFHFAFQDRDVIFMARNPHLRKAGMVRFSGLCSDASYILRSKDEKIISQEFLAVLLQSNHFWDYCESHKVGSVNFANNWSTIANYEFELPSPEFQKELSDKVWAAYEVKQSYLKMIEATQEMVKSQFIEMFGDISINSKAWPVEKLANVADIKIGPFGSLIHQRDYQEGGHCLINPSQIINNKVVPDSKVAVTEYKYQELLSYTVSIGDIILGRRGEMGRAGIIEEEGMLCGTGSMVLRPKDKGDSLFLHLFITSPHSKEWLENNSVGTTMMNLNTQIVGNMEIPVLPVNLKRQFVAIANQADKSILELRKSIDAIDKVIKSLINENL